MVAAIPIIEITFVAAIVGVHPPIGITPLNLAPSITTINTPVIVRNRAVHVGIESRIKRAKCRGKGVVHFVTRVTLYDFLPGRVVSEKGLGEQLARRTGELL